MKLLKLFILFLPGIINSQNYPSFKSLNEFRFGDHISKLDSIKYPLLQKGKLKDGTVYKSYLIDKSTTTYIVFRFPVFRKEYVFGIQITGYSKDIQLLENLRLGDSKEKVFDLFGNPSDSSFVENVSCSLYTFKNRNYSVEIDKNNKLYSLSLMGDKGLLEKYGWPSGWLKYIPGSIENEKLIITESLKDIPEKGLILLASPRKFKPRVKYLGDSRNLSPENEEIIKLWAKTKSQLKYVKHFTKEIYVSENSKKYWIPIQDVLIPDLNKYSKSGKEPVDLFVMAIGYKAGKMTMLINEFLIW